MFKESKEGESLVMLDVVEYADDDVIEVVAVLNRPADCAKKRPKINLYQYNNLQLHPPAS